MARNKSCFFSSSVGLAVGTTCVTINMAAATLSGAIGSAIMTDAGYQGYNVSEAALMGAAGGAIVGIPSGALICCITACVMMAATADRKTVSTDFQPAASCSFLNNVLYSVASGLVGHALIHPHMPLAETAIAFCIGSVLTSIALTVVLVCCFIPLILGGMHLNETVKELSNLNPHYGTF